jgi:hypothetical protein
LLPSATPWPDPRSLSSAEHHLVSFALTCCAARSAARACCVAAGQRPRRGAEDGGGAAGAGTRLRARRGAAPPGPCRTRLRMVIGASDAWPPTVRVGGRRAPCTENVIFLSDACARECVNWDWQVYSTDRWSTDTGLHRDAIVGLTSRSGCGVVHVWPPRTQSSSICLL